MDSIQLSTRGGMDANPFGGESRIDRINLLEFLEPYADPDKVLYLRVIQDAISNYLYAFLGKNGTSPKEFFGAWQYFFKITSSDRSSWDHHRIIRRTYTSKGQRISEKHYLTDEELKLMCFDKHYVLSGLAEHIDIDKFRLGIKEKRKKILDNNWTQVVSYVKSLYQGELNQIVTGQQVPIQLWNEDLKAILIDPPSPYHLASIIYVPSKLKKVSKSRTRKTNKVDTFGKLVEKINTGKIQPLPNDWGPISQLLGESNDKTTSNDLNHSVHCDGDRYSSAT